VAEIRRVYAEEGRQHQSALAELLLDSVAGGASIGFMASVTKPEAELFFDKVLTAVERDERILLAAFVDSALLGTVQIVPSMMPNQPHRADISKLMVHRSVRGKGVASMLMRHAEESARAAGKSVLVLDTCTGTDAERLYMRLGWTRAGIVPHYALFPDGSSCDTVIFWKRLTA
jgi:ribosomal protein S18 acetylase RimI-like enzyme